FSGRFGPAPTPAVTKARRGDLTLQHGGGSRLGPWVGAFAAAGGPCRKQPPPPPPLSSLLGQGPGPGVQLDVASQSLDQEILLKVKIEIEEELKSLDKEISEAFTSTGFDRHTSPVFSPANPESSMEDCLAHLGEKVSQELKEPLHTALQMLLSQPVTYQAFRECTLETTVHASGWNKGTVFSLESEEEEYPGITAEDSNDIYILPSDNSGQVSPPESPTVTTSWQSESLPVSLSASQSWHTESLPVSLGPESWQQIAMDPEEVKSLDSNGAGEKSENNSSNSDIVHVEKEEVPEGMEEAALASVVLPAGELPEALPEAPAPLLPHITATSLLGTREPDTEVITVEKSSPATSLFVELDEEEVKAATVELTEVEEVVPAPEPTETLLSEKETNAREESLGEELSPPGEMKPLPLSEGKSRLSPAGEMKPLPLSEGKSILLFGGAAAVAILAMAIGVALALRKK
uniref:BCL2 like 13 n=1 Tax=Colobus angolensis palliatus TaxID=336983 RepID=A0A2K5IS39_COLAP